MFKRIFLIALIASLACMLENAPFANSQALTVVSKFVKNDIPIDPIAPVWNRVNGITIRLGPQIIVKPRTFVLPKGKSTVRWVNVKCINNGKHIAFLLEWKDMTKNSMLNDTAAYRDAAALQFPVKIPNKEAEYPYFGMGHEGAPVNIWQWKADLEGRRDTVALLGAANPGKESKYSAGFDRSELYQLASKEKERRGPVEDLNAEGLGTLTLQASQDVMGKGLWSGGKWSVVFWRPMITMDKDDAKFERGTILPIAFAIWDGSNLEKEGLKSISTWHELKIE